MNNEFLSSFAVRLTNLDKKNFNNNQLILEGLIKAMPQSIIN